MGSICKNLCALVCGAIVRCQPDRQLGTETSEQFLEITGPANSNSDVAYGIFNDEIPSNNPGDQFSQRCVRIRIGAAGDGNHGSKLSVAQSAKPTRYSGQKVREYERWASSGSICRASDRRTGGCEYAGSDDSANPQCRQVHSTECSFQTMSRFFGFPLQTIR